MVGSHSAGMGALPGRALPLVEHIAHPSGLYALQSPLFDQIRQSSCWPPHIENSRVPRRVHRQPPIFAGKFVTPAIPFNHVGQQQFFIV